MRNSAVTSGIVVLVALLACGKKEDEQPPQTAANMNANAYPQQQPGAYPQQPGAYPQQQPGMQPTGQPTMQQPGAVAPGGASPMATPGPLALPCTSDSNCLYGKCNTQFQKCAFPCQRSEIDCIQGAVCNTMTGLCGPKIGQ